MEIKAPMPGKIASISVSVGSQVKEEDEVIIMDAMKMEIPVYAPGSGIVKEIKVKVGESVNEGQLLAVIYISK
jgi:acetyl-CoA carboxylase biotin carboxyl carrier protein